MSFDLVLATLVVLLGGFGTWLLLPHRHGSMKPRRTQLIGTGLAVLSILLMARFFQRPSELLTSFFFYAFAFASLGGGILTITSRNPVYSALWFASVVLATSGLFLLAGAQFLAAGTVIVYAGAIIVTFLFVIMLAQSEGQALYDRMARAPGAASLSGFVLLWAVFYALLMVQNLDGAGQNSPNREPPVIPASGLVMPEAKVGPGKVPGNSPVASVFNRSVTATARIPASRGDFALGTAPPHVAGLGATLFTDHLLSVELAGALLFVALVGAIAIATPRAPVRPATLEAVTAGDPAQAAGLVQASS